MDLLKNLKPDFSFKNFKEDFSAGIVVYLVALPLCIGISFASGAPIIAGIISGIIGGIIIGYLSGSQLSVAGPAAGLTIIVLDSIKDLGDYNIFLTALFIAGMIQFVLGILNAGVLGSFFPSSVVKGMMAGIGIILILKQIPHSLGNDLDYEGDLDFFQKDMGNTFTSILDSLAYLNKTALLISIISLLILVLWDKYKLSKKMIVHGSFVVVVLGVGINWFLKSYYPTSALYGEHMVQLFSNPTDVSLLNYIVTPNFKYLFDYDVWSVGFKIAVIASLESLLSLEAVDKLDPEKKFSSKSRELWAQGIGNTFASLIGGLPMTSVVVRSSANVDAGAKTKLSTIIHGILLFLTIFLFPSVINMIPLSSLAAVLIVVGYKLTKWSVVKDQIEKGIEHYLPFFITIGGLVFHDILIGIAVGTVVALVFILRRIILNPFKYNRQDKTSGIQVRIELAEEVSFLSKASIQYKLNKVPQNAHLIIDGSKAKYIDDDVMEIIDDFKIQAKIKNIKVELYDVEDKFEVLNNEALDKIIQQDYEKLFVNNKNWVKEKLAEDEHFFDKLALGQSPKYLFIGCSDSRVPANEITGTDAGEMFMHRNIANLVIDTDMNLMAVLQYSVQVLKVKHIIVCGHYGCGGVRAAMDGQYHGLIDKWLTHIKNVYRLYHDKLTPLLDDDERHRRLVEYVVREQVFNVAKTSIVQSAWKSGENVQIHGWVYDIAEGYLKDLAIDPRKDFKEFEIYKYNF